MRGPAGDDGSDDDRTRSTHDRDCRGPAHGRGLRLGGVAVSYRRLFEAAHDGILIVDPDTRKIIDAGLKLGITVHDHVIVGREGHTSFRGSKLI